MSGVPFHYVDLRAFSYETEDRQLVEAALRTLLPEEVAIERTETTGHHGDRILVLSARVETADEMRTILDALRQSPDAERLRLELADRIDEDCSLHVHLDKQAAATGAVELGRGIAFRAKVEAYPADKTTAVANAREAL